MLPRINIKTKVFLFVFLLLTLIGIAVIQILDEAKKHIFSDITTVGKGAIETENAKLSKLVVKPDQISECVPKTM